MVQPREIEPHSHPHRLPSFSPRVFASPASISQPQRDREAQHSCIRFALR